MDNLKFVSYAIKICKMYMIVFVFLAIGGTASGFYTVEDPVSLHVLFSGKVP